MHDPIAHLDRSLAALDDALGELALSAGDFPASPEPAVAEAIRDGVAELRGELAGLSALARRGSADALAACHERINVAARRLRAEIASAPTILEIAAIGAARRGAWRKWSAAVQQALDRSAAAADDVAAAMVHCWRDAAQTRA